ncbi:MAG: DUF2235 domain-containing protein [Proteobacteria bacterium]|nr:DUF2235 domain-containing protein [Pseudomonadota bacterium]
MTKNIILCADGTGNKGGYTPDSNVYKIYNGIDIHNEGNEQIIFYDNGVGTAKNKYLRAAGGAFGIGFGQNVRDLYEFLVKNYNPGDDDNPADRVYLFGFSRGAATVRAFSGFVAACGLIKYKNTTGIKMNARELKGAVKETFREYVKIGRQHKGEIPPLATASEGNHGAVRIEFIGVWDTVSALGFPQRTDVTSIGMWVINLLLVGLGHLSDLLFPHRFYNYELTDNVLHACQALAIDDERTSFWPMVWDETARTSGSVEQVWFAGMHSNVGGGYQRAGVANVPHEWMIFRTHLQGLTFKTGIERKAAEDAHVHGRLYNSRDGAAIYYRYHPRKIEKLCKGDGKKNKARISGHIKIHESVIRRMARRTANYAPGHLPDTFETVATNDIGGTRTTTYEPHRKDGWLTCRAQIARVTLFRKWLYGMFLEFTLVVVVFAGYYWICPTCIGQGGDPDPAWSIGWIMDHIADVLNYVLPDFFGGLITVAVINNPKILGGAILVLGFLIGARIWARRKTMKACEKARDVVLDS